MSEDKTPAQNGGIVSDRRRHGLRPNLLDTQRDTPAYRARIGAIFGRSSHYPPDEWEQTRSTGWHSTCL